MRLDSVFTVETPEGIALSLRPAGAVARCLAYLIDFAIRLCIFMAALMASAALGGMGQAFLLITFFVLEWWYPVVFELARGAATPGKRVMGLRVVMDSGLPVTPGASIIRNLLRAADFMPAFYALGAASMLLRPDFKRLGDLAAGTLVVYQEAVDLHGELPQAQPLAPPRALSGREQKAIVSWAGRARRLTPERFEELAGLAAPLLTGGHPAASASQRLLGITHWLLGRRSEQRP